MTLVVPSTGSVVAPSVPDDDALPRRGRWVRFRRHRAGFAAFVALLVIGLAVLVGPALLPYETDRIDFTQRSLAPTLAHPMGTDELGRDQMVRVLDGGRISLSVGLAVVLVAATVGVTIGAIAGYMGGATDNALMRLADVVTSMPGLFVIILLVSLLGAGFWTIVVGLGVLGWPTTARLVRSEFLSLREREFVEAARALGTPGWRIVIRHLLPNAVSPIVVSATLGVASAILTESALSFLGLGFQPPQATWGRMLQEAQTAVIQNGFWWRGFFPGALIFATVLSVNFLGDALRDAMDPRASRG